MLAVGQNPGRAEDKDGRPFVGPSGKVLRLLTNAAGVPVKLYGRTNAVRCLSPGNRPPKTEEIDNCFVYLIEEIRELNPAVIVALGETAVQALTGRTAADAETFRAAEAQYALDFKTFLTASEVWMERTDSGKRKVKGLHKPKPPVKPKRRAARKTALRDIAGVTLWQSETGVPVIPTYHPAFLMRRNWNYSALVIEHFKKAMRIANIGQAVGSLGEYHTIKTLPALEALRDYLLSDAGDTIYFDVETTGLDWQKAELICISFAGRRDEGYVVPVLHNSDGRGALDLWPAWDGHMQEFLALLREIFGSGKAKCGHNVLFDYRILTRSSKTAYVDAYTAFGIPINGPLKDTELMHQVVAETLPHNMTNLLALYTDLPYYEAELNVVTQGKKKMWLAPDELLWKYSAADADAVARLEEAIMPIIRAEGTEWVLENVSYNLLRLCRDMEENGILIDLDNFGRLCQFYGDRVAEAEEALWEAAPEYGRGWKYRHSKRLNQILFVDLKLPAPDRKTKGSRECEDCHRGVCFKHFETGKDALEEVAETMGDSVHPIIPALLRLKDYTGIKSTFLDGGKGGWKKHIRSDNRIHGSFKISRTETGRLASENPNLHNPPKELHVHPL